MPGHPHRAPRFTLEEDALLAQVVMSPNPVERKHGSVISLKAEIDELIQARGIQAEPKSARQWNHRYMTYTRFRLNRGGSFDPDCCRVQNPPWTPQEFFLLRNYIPIDIPGGRGDNRFSIVAGDRIEADWNGIAQKMDRSLPDGDNNYTGQSCRNAYNARILDDFNRPLAAIPRPAGSPPVVVPSPPEDSPINMESAGMELAPGLAQSMEGGPVRMDPAHRAALAEQLRGVGQIDFPLATFQYGRGWVDGIHYGSTPLDAVGMTFDAELANYEDTVGVEDLSSDEDYEDYYEEDDEQ